MAKTTAPLLSFGAAGQIGSTLVASRWKGRPYMRRYVIPANPNTAGQQTTRNSFLFANAVWKLAPSLFIDPWDLFATGQVLTGRNAMVGRFVRDTRPDSDLQNMVFSPGAKGGLPPSSVILTPGSGSINVAFTNPDPPTGWTLASAVAAAILDQDPQSGTDYVMVAAEDTVTFNSVDLTGLTPSVLYAVGAWLQWTKPDGSTAYGTSLQSTATPTV